MIRSLKEMTPPFFRPLISVVAPPSEIIDLGIEESPIRFDILENALLSAKKQNRPIHLIMVFGAYQSGKSTFLRALTGNNAFYSGTGGKSTTQGILMDGPYSSDELINRVQTKSFKDECLRDDIKPKDNPAIFFFDSQGTGDEKYEAYYKKIMERVHSIFCTVSDICINITDINETAAIMKETLTTIRRGQMAMNSSEITKIFFLVKHVQREIENNFSIGTRKGFVDAQKKLQPIWEEQHNIVSERYNKDLIKAFPLGDINAPNSYLCSVWNTLIDILCNFRKETCIDEIIKRARFNSIALFSSFFNIINQNNENETILPDFLKYSSKAEKDIFYLCSYSRAHIKSSLEQCQILSFDPKKIAEYLQLVLRFISEVFAPFILGCDDISIDDFFQFSYEIKRDFNAFIKVNHSDWSSLDKKKNNFIQYWYSINSLLFPLYPFSPISLISQEIIYGLCAMPSIFFILNINYNQKKINDLIFKAFPMTIPFLWERNIVEKGLQIINFDDINILVKKSDLRKNKLILAIEQPDCDLSFILQSMTGIKCEFKDKEQVVAKFGPIEGSELIKRIQRVQNPLKSDINNSKVTILYLKGYQNEEINKIQFQEYISSSFTAVKMGEELNIFPQNPLRFWVLTLVHELPMYYFGRKQITSVIPIITRENPELHNPMLSIRLPIIGNNFDFSQCGPRTNTTLRFAFRAIYFEEKIIKEIID